MRLKGTKAADQLHGAAQGDVVSGLGGGDLITGDGGGDRLVGGAGDDTLYGGRESLWPAPVSSVPGNDTLEGDAGADSLIGDAADDFLDGGADADYLYGAPGDDLLIGGAGRDSLNGGWGSDTLDGGAGDDSFTADEDGAADVFRFEAPKSGGGFGHDSVSGFEPGGDQIRFAGYTEADLAGPVQTTTIDSPWNYSMSTEWHFEFKDGSHLTVSFQDQGAHYDGSGTLVGTTPVAGRTYIFA